MVDALKYFDDVNMKINSLNKRVITEVVIDDDKIAEMVAEKMKRNMSGKTSEGIGGWS